MHGRPLSNNEFSVVETTIVIFERAQFQVRQAWTFQAKRVKPEPPYAA